MSAFKDADDVYANIGEIFRIAITDPEIGPKVKDSGLTLRFDFSDPDAKLYVDFVNGQVLTGADAPATAPMVTMGISAENGNKFWLGNLNLVMAMAKGKVRTKGSVPDMLKLLPLAKPLYVKYAEHLKATGREDLIAAGK
jgi:putative sterol carrier protein